MAEYLLHCKVGSLPFKYPGLLVSANPKKKCTWDLLVNLVSKRLSSWRNRFSNLGGRVVLLNSALNFIPVFFFSFMKMPILVWKKLVGMHMCFIWRGSKVGVKFAWVKWEDVCKAKRTGGLEVKDLRLMNLSLLIK